MATPKFAPGDLVAVSLTLPDQQTMQTGGLVLLSWPWGDHRTHYLVCALDPHSSGDPYQISLEQSDLSHGEMSVRCFIRPTYQSTLHEGRLGKCLAKLTPHKFRDVVDDLADILYENFVDDETDADGNL